MWGIGASLRQRPHVAEHYAPALLPQAARLGELNAQILSKTPTRELWARYRLLQQDVVAAMLYGPQRVVELLSP